MIKIGKRLSERAREVLERVNLVEVLRQYRLNCGKHAIKNARVRRKSEERLWKKPLRNYDLQTGESVRMIAINSERRRAVQLAEEESRLILDEIRKIDMGEVWRDYAEDVAPILELNRRARIESRNPANAHFYG